LAFLQSVTTKFFEKNQGLMITLGGLVGWKLGDYGSGGSDRSAMPVSMGSGYWYWN
jgi:hypothetical protein